MLLFAPAPDAAGMASGDEVARKRGGTALVGEGGKRSGRSVVDALVLICDISFSFILHPSSGSSPLAKCISHRAILTAESNFSANCLYHRRNSP